MRKLEIALVCALAICVFSAAKQIPFSLACEDIRSDTLRLHIVANSDSDPDQAVKLLVRDAVLKESEAFSTSADKAQAEEKLSRSLEEIEQTANRTLSKNGFAYTAKAKICEMYFDERKYENVTLPAGNYTALRIELGEAKGKNWWCVIYPSVCLSAATEEKLSGYSETEKEVVSEPNKYEVRFKIEEWIQKLSQGRP